jgi:predicted branched-subunit amino acid permease
MELAPPIRFELRRGAVTAIPLAIAVGLFGVSFGVLSASTGGMGALPAIVMSATTFAGSAQFAAASVLAGGGGPLTAIVAALLLNARYSRSASASRASWSAHASPVSSRRSWWSTNRGRSLLAVAASSMPIASWARASSCGARGSRAP